MRARQRAPRSRRRSRSPDLLRAAVDALHARCRRSSRRSARKRSSTAATRICRPTSAARIRDLLESDRLVIERSAPRSTSARSCSSALSERRRSAKRRSSASTVASMKFVYEKEFVAQRAGPDAVAELYRARGLSTDTAVEAGYVVYNGLGVLKSLDPDATNPPRADRRARTRPRAADGFLEDGRPESYQPWAVIDALVSLGLSRLDDLAVVGADINPRVVDHLRERERSPPALTLVSGIAETPTRASSPGTTATTSRSSGARLATRAGRRRRAWPGICRRPCASARPWRGRCRAEPLDIVTERLDGRAVRSRSSRPTSFRTSTTRS